MRIKTHTQYVDNSGKVRIISRKLRSETLKKWNAGDSKYIDIDVYAPSRGYFNIRPTTTKDV